MATDAMTNDNSSPSNRQTKGRNTANNTLEKNLSYPNVSPKEWLLLHANLKVVSVSLPQKQLHVRSTIQQDWHLRWQD